MIALLGDAARLVVCAVNDEFRGLLADALQQADHAHTGRPFPTLADHIRGEQDRYRAIVDHACALIDWDEADR